MTSNNAENKSDSKASCCLCGAPSTQRCSSYAKFDFDIFFCSRAHQKVVWPAHRRVCGENSKPFRWPRLTGEEAKRLLGPLRDPANSMFKKELTVESQKVPGVIKSLGEGYDGPALVSLDREQEMLLWLRALLHEDYQDRIGAISTEAKLEFIRRPVAGPPYCAVDALANVVLECLPLPRQAVLQPWWTPLLHKWLTHYQVALLLSDAIRRGGIEHDLVEFSEHVLRECQRYMIQEVTPIDPIGAKEPLEKFSQLGAIYRRVYG